MKDFKIFLVDDDLFSLYQYRQGLNDLGYKNIELFENGSLCLNSLHRKPSVVFLDHHQHESADFEVLKKIKRYNPNIYVVIVSMLEDRKTAADALQHGAFDYMVKNGNEIPKMKDALERIIAIQEELDRLTRTFSGN